MGHHLEVIRVDTHAVVALVVNLLLAGNKPMDVGEGDNVNCHCLTVKAHARVAPTPASTRVRATPHMAESLISMVFQTDVAQDLGLNLCPSAHGHRLAVTMRTLEKIPLGFRILVFRPVTT